MSHIDKTKEELLAELRQLHKRVAELETAHGFSEESQERTRFLANTLDKSSNPFLAGYPNGDMITCNRAFCDLTGFSEEELRSMNWQSSITPPDLWDLQSKVIDDINNSGKPLRYEKESIHKNGSTIPVEVFIHPLFDGQSKLQIVTVSIRFPLYLWNCQIRFST